MRKTLKYLLISCAVLNVLHAADEGKDNDLEEPVLVSRPAAVMGSSGSDSQVVVFDPLTRLDALPTKTVSSGAFWWKETNDFVLKDNVRGLLEKAGTDFHKLHDEMRAMRASFEEQTVRLSELGASLGDNQALQRALEEAQRRADEAEEQALEAKIQRAAIELELRKEREKLEAQQTRMAELLTAQNAAEADALAQKLRAEGLARTIEENEKVIRSLREQEAELERIAAEKRLLEQLLAQQQGKTEGEIKKLQQMIQEKNEQEEKLRQEVARLTEEQAEKEALIEQYQRAHQEGDYYNYLLGLINDRNVDDDGLAQQLYATMIRSGKSLDELHPDEEISLAEAIRQVTRPTDEAYRNNYRVRGGAGDNYKDSWRLLGNQIHPVGWGAVPPLVRFKGSKLEKAFNQTTKTLVKNSQMAS